MLFSWYKAKKAELKVKGMFYGAIASIIGDHKSIFEMIQKLFEELKTANPDELRSELISKIAELVHNDNKTNAE